MALCQNCVFVVWRKVGWHYLRWRSGVESPELSPVSGVPKPGWQAKAGTDWIYCGMGCQVTLAWVSSGGHLSSTQSLIFKPLSLWNQSMQSLQRNTGLDICDTHNMVQKKVEIWTLWWWGRRKRKWHILKWPSWQDCPARYGPLSNNLSHGLTRLDGNINTSLPSTRPQDLTT